jgi:hypothetical protein
MAKGSKTGALKLYRSYMFRGKDPVVDEIRTIMQDSYGEKLDNKAMKDVEQNGGPTAGTIRNWLFGDTKRPQNASIEAAGRAIGMKRVWVVNNGKKK